MAGSVNHCVLVGPIGKYGVELRSHATGTAYASFVLVLTEQSSEGKYYTTLIPCECWRKRAEAWKSPCLLRRRKACQRLLPKGSSL